jgi:hypothetical protein
LVDAVAGLDVGKERASQNRKEKQAEQSEQSLQVRAP